MITIALGAIISVVNFFGESIYINFKRHFKKIMSFSAGVSLTYIILHLFPFFSEGALDINRFLFLAVLFGFLFFHLIEKYIYKSSPEDRLLQELAIEDSSVSFLYHFLVGIMLVSFFERSFQEGILFFIPAILYTSTNTLPVDITKSQVFKFFLATATLLGVVFAEYFYILTTEGLYAFLGFIIGAMLFTVTRHSIPGGKSGEPYFFTMGVIFYSIILFAFPA